MNIKGEIFKYVKKGFWFDDEVLEKAGIKRIIREEKVETVLIEEKTKSENIKTYPKATESLKNLFKSINTLDNIADNYHETETILSDEEYKNNNLDDE